MEKKMSLLFERKGKTKRIGRENEESENEKYRRKDKENGQCLFDLLLIGGVAWGGGDLGKVGGWLPGLKRQTSSCFFCYGN